MDVRFLPPAEVARAVSELLGRAAIARLAVSFWGKAALSNLQLHRPDLDLKVLLNLPSGAVDPAVVETLGRDRVRSLSSLHAKIYWTDAGAIVGSCNASANGLGFSDSEIDGQSTRWDEAAVYLPPHTAAWRDAETCMNALFAQGAKITDSMLKEALEAWKYRRRHRRSPHGPRAKKTLLQVLRENPEGLRNCGLYFLLEEECEPPEATDKVKAMAASLGISGAQLDLWEGRVPLGIRALYFTFSTEAPSKKPIFSYTAVSETADSPAAYIPNKKNPATIGRIGNATSLGREVGATFSDPADVEGLQPLLQTLWRRKGEDWNFYRDRDWPSVLVSVDDVIEKGLLDAAEQGRTRQGGAA